MQLCGSLSILCISFLWDWNATNLFQSCGHCWVFQICWHIALGTFTASSFRIWNSSTGIPSPPLALFIVMLLRPIWLHIPGCLALGEWSHHHDYLGGEDLFLYSSSVYSCHLFSISSASIRSIPFLPFIEHIFARNISLVSLVFLKRSLVFPILLFSSIPLHWSLRKAFLSHSAILWNSAFQWVYLSFSSLPFTSLLSSAICKASSDNLSLAIVLITASSTMSWTSVHISSGALSGTQWIISNLNFLFRVPFSFVDKFLF